MLTTESARPDTTASAQRFPRVLFITSAAFNHSSGGGITFTNLFRGWPKACIATAHDDATPVTTDICEQYYRLGTDEIDAWPIPRPQRAAAAAAPNAVSEPFGRALLPRVKSAIFGDGLPERGRLTPALEQWIESYRPELIYTILGGTGLMEVIEAVQRRFALPLVVHFMDDWPSAIHRGGLLSPLQRRRMNRLIARLIGSATTRLGICEAMCAEYAQRFGCPFLSFQNTIDVALWSLVAKRDLAVGTPVRLIYAGSVLGFAQAASLVDCCEAVAALAAGGLEIVLDIYSPLTQTAPLYRQLACAPSIALHDTITDDDTYFKTLAAADILLLPVNFDAHSQRYIRLSMPTKVPSYLVSGTPILAYGPPGIAQIDYARKSGWGHVVDRRDGVALAASIRRLAEDVTLRRALSDAARTTVTARHDAARVRPLFQAALAAVARAGVHG